MIHNNNNNNIKKTKLQIIFFISWALLSDFKMQMQKLLVLYSGEKPWLNAERTEGKLTLPRFKIADKRRNNAVECTQID
jgi:hypothetical protein